MTNQKPTLLRKLQNRRMNNTVYVDSSLRALLQFQSPFGVRTQQVPDFFIVDLDVRREDQELDIVRHGYGFKNVFESPGYYPALVRQRVYALHRETFATSRLSVCEHCTIVTFQNSLSASNTIYYIIIISNNYYHAYPVGRMIYGICRKIYYWFRYRFRSVYVSFPLFFFFLTESYILVTFRRARKIVEHF